ncbi:MAG: RNA polymerase sigma factor [Bacteroidales bacterium]|jgi:RNA polymerase sigma-70 factor (ECF subfamily)|nr:RNA polymerase sigma factor [Bacteroidales bacterium]
MDKDTVLISRVLMFGDKRAYGRLVVKYQNSVRRFILHLNGGNSTQADDLAQEAFIKAYLNLSSFKALSKFSTWLMGIAYRLYIDDYRKHCREVLVENIPENLNFANLGANLGANFGANLGANLGNDSEKVDLNHDISVALKILSEDERAVTLLFYIEDLGIKDVCKTLKMVEGTAKSHLSRARQKIRKFYETSATNV